LGKNEKELIRPSTLREMQRVQWLDADGKNSRGLGFGVRQLNGIVYAGHGGSCPGYVTQLLTIPAEKLGVAVMINAQGTEAYNYALGVLNILKKAKRGEASAENLKLDDYAGYYDDFAWYGEVMVVPWQGKLLVSENPTINPIEDMDMLKPMGNDVFRRVRSDETLGEEVRFDRDNSGKVIRMRWNSNYMNKTR
jgi:hypothetical protein